MEVQQDFNELLALFNAHDVAYGIVGAYALAHLGAPRYTRDLDILVWPEPENARRILDAFARVWFRGFGTDADRFHGFGQCYSTRISPCAVDLVTSITGVSWEDVDANKENGTYDDVRVFFIGRDQLVQNKRMSGRQRDLADLEALGES